MKPINGLLCGIVLLFGSELSRAQDGIYSVSPTKTERSATNNNAEMVWIGKKTGTEIHKAWVYSLDNANTRFAVALETSDYTVDPKSLALCVGSHAYVPNGWGSSQGHNNSLSFIVSDREEAQAAAKTLSVECALRSPPGCKYIAQFIPSQKEFSNGAPVMVKFVLKNLDDKPVVFNRGGSQRGARDNQYGFRAMFYGAKPVPDVGDPIHFGGIGYLVTLEPGKSFDDTIDLRKWFAFDKPGTYYIHGFYAMAFYRPGTGTAAMTPTDMYMLWSDYASTDFEVVIK